MIGFRDMPPYKVLGISFILTNDGSVPHDCRGARSAQRLAE